jgi:hypothetical protein
MLALPGGLLRLCKLHAGFFGFGVVLLMDSLGLEVRMLTLATRTLTMESLFASRMEMMA